MRRIFISSELPGVFKQMSHIMISLKKGEIKDALRIAYRYQIEDDFTIDFLFKFKQ